MKIRNGFVSNSSSSSFIVISDEGKHESISLYRDTLVYGERGETEFGWQEERYDDFYSKLNFCVLQTKYVDEEKSKLWLDMIEKVLREKLNVMYTENSMTDNYTLSLKDGQVFGYIDHQSCSGEGENTEMFVSEEVLKNFLFNPNSYIQCDNDNH